MKKLLGLRTVYDIDPTKTFRIADILEAGAILPHSVRIEDLMIADLEAEEDDEKCICIFYIGDNGVCPVHGALDDSSADYQESKDLYTMGMGA